jgi:hypothetical protein
MGHASVLTTLSSYGHVSPERQAEIINALGRSDVSSFKGDMATEIATKVAAMLSEIRK